jgi:hypothetical protein
MKALIHIGAGRGSSVALQKALAAARPALERCGVLYPAPQPPLAQTNQQIAAWGVIPASRLPRDLTAPFADAAALAAAHAGFAARLGAAIDRRRPACVALSAETLFRPLPPDRLARLAALLGEPAGVEIEIVAYLRRPADRFATTLQQTLRYAHALRRPLHPRYRDVLESYEDAFGFRRVHARALSSATLAGGDVAHDFAARWLAPYGVEPAAMPVIAPQARLSAEALGLCRAFRRAFHEASDGRSSADSRELAQELQRLDGEAGARPARLRPEIADALDYSSYDALWLRDRHGVDFPGFDYARLERGGTLPLPPPEPRDLDDLFAIDPAAEAALLEGLGAGSWAADGPDAAARRAWIDARLAGAVHARVA